MASTTEAGERRAWELLAALDPDAVCRAAAAAYDSASKRYTVRSFGGDIAVSLADRSVGVVRPTGGEPAAEYAELFPLAVLWYLALAKEIHPTGRLVHPADIPGADIFARGSHVLPLEKLAQRYGNDREGFLRKGLAQGGEAVRLADAAVLLAPFPRVPATVTLWLGDEEFPARASLLFDSTCSLQLPTDILWSLARLTCLSLL